MALTKSETFDKAGSLVTREYRDDNGAAIDAATAAAQATALSSLLAKLPAALTNNATYLAIALPTNAQVAAQVAALTRQIDALGRIVGGLLDSTAGT